MASNATLSFSLPPLPDYTLKPLPPLLPFISDANLTVIAPVLAYWIVSIIFHIIDEWDLFPQYRLHTPAEILKRNKATRWEVLRDVIIQQVLQMGFGFVLTLIEEDAVYGKEGYDVAVWAQRVRLAQRGIPTVLGLVGVNAGGIADRISGSKPVLAGALAGGHYPLLQQLVRINGEQVVAPAFAAWEMNLAKFIYWIGVPAIQLSVAMVILDTWQYFLHRAMHMNHTLYTWLHSRHHRLYVPYAYGALYNHPVEGFILDTLGAGVAYFLAGLTGRQSLLFFTFCTIKTVDDHCGYSLPWDPLQHITGNNAAYHDIHHQSWGIKSNFSQPFFTVWDRVLGTMWRGGDVRLRYERGRQSAEEWIQRQRRLAAQGNATQTEATTTPSVSGTSTPDLSASVSTIEDSTPPASLRRSPRKKPSSGQVQLKGLKDRVSGNLLGGAVQRVDSNR